MSKTKNSAGTPGLTHFAVPAIVGAAAASAVIALFLAFGPGRAPTASVPPSPVAGTDVVSDSQRAAIEKTIEEYLLANPQILMKMSEELERQQNDDRLAQVRQTISSSADEIYRDDYGLVAGNPNGDVTVVEFSDYNCPYCKRAFDAVAKLIEEDPNVRIVLKEFPIFGERSEGAARVAIAAAKQGRYFDLHAALLKNKGQNNEETALKIAEGLGLDMDKLREDANSEEVSKIIRDTRDLGNRLGIQGTPFYLVGDKIIPGAPEDLYDTFRRNVAEIRKSGCQVGC